MGRKIVVFDRFVGEAGKRNLWNAPSDTFNAVNMWRYQTGELGPRPGLRQMTPAGAATGIVRGFGCSSVPNKDVWFAIGNSVYSFDGSTAASLRTASGSTTGASATSVFDYAPVGTAIYMTAKSMTNSYKVEFNTGAGVAPAVTTLTGSPAGRTICSYGDRLVIGDVAVGNENRLRFCDALNYNSWPSANFIDVSDGWLITGLYSQRQHLLITKQNGFYVLTGVPGVNPVLRKVSSDFGPLGALEATLAQDDVLYNWPIFGHQPARMNGSRQVREFALADHIPNSGAGDVFPPQNGVSPITDNMTGAVYLDKTTNKMVAYYNNGWSYHTFGSNISGFTAKFGGTFGNLWLCDGGGASASPKFYTMDLHLDRPGFESDGAARAGDDSATQVAGSVNFQEFWDKSGEEFFVKAVVVDFRSWNTGGSSTNHFDLTVDAMRTYQDSTVSSTTRSFDQAGSSSSTSGTIQRRIFGFGEQGVGNGFALRLANIRGVALHRIEVILDTKPARI